MAQSICSFPDCDKPVRARGWCTTHYARWSRRGDVNVTLVGRRSGPYPNERRPVAERFWEKVDKTGSCWIWTAQLNRHRGGYGMFWDEKPVWAHRWAYEALVGPIPDGLVLDHLCRTPACVNPTHLEPVTIEENVRRGELGRDELGRFA